MRHSHHQASSLARAAAVRTLSTRERYELMVPFVATAAAPAAPETNARRSTTAAVTPAQEGAGPRPVTRICEAASVL